MTTEPTVIPPAQAVPGLAEPIPAAQPIPAAATVPSAEAMPPSEPVAPPPAEPVVHEPWYLAEGHLGSGPRPEYLDSKFVNMQEQAKGYAELEAKFGGHSGAPGEYNLEFLNNLPLSVDPNDPLLLDFIGKSKIEGINQKSFETAVSSHVAARKAALPDPAEEFKKLGPTGSEQLNVLRQWAVNNLNADETQDILSYCTTASRISLMQKLRGISQPAVVPAHGTGVNAPRVESVEALQKELGMADNNAKYNQNGEYTKSWDERFRVAHAVEAAAQGI